MKSAAAVRGLIRMGNRGATRLKDGLVLGRFRIVRAVRRHDAEGFVDAMDEDTREMAALKLATTSLEEEAARTELQELCRKLATVRNPHLVPMHGCDVAGRWGFQIYAPMTAEVLAQAHEVGEKFTPAQSLRIVDDIATGLHALHEGGLCHGDLSPENVVIARQNRARLLGIGLQATLNPPVDDSGDQRPRPYFAPERLKQGPSPVADLYSLGLVLYELLTGRQPLSTVAGYQPGSRDSLTPRPPARFANVAPHLPRSLEALTFSLLQADPGERCQTAGAFRERIRRLVAGAQRKTTPRPAK